MHHFNFCFTSHKSSEIKAYKLKESVPCYAFASDSTILSLSAFIINHFPILRPPTVSQDIYSNIKFDQSFIDCSNAYHPLESAWSSYIVDLVIGNHAVYYDRTLFVEVPVEELPSFEHLNKLFEAIEIKEQIQDHHERCRYLFGLPQIERTGNKIGIVSYRPRSGNILEPHLNTPALFIGNLYNNEQWTIFKIGNNEIPSLQELLTFRCIILPGSTYNISDNAPNVIKVALARILQAYRFSKDLKLIGVCFGHQILAQSFGAKIEKLKRVDGTETIYFNQAVVKQYPFLDGIANMPKLFLSQYHGDYVTTMPKKFVLLAHSKSCQFQSFISTNGRIFTTQFHSEYFRSFMKRLQAVFRTYYGKVSISRIEDPQCQDLENANHHHASLMLQCLRKFIDH